MKEHALREARPLPDWRSPELGERRELKLRDGTIRCHVCGSGPAIVFVHGWLANANLWRKVVPLLAGRFQCVVLDMPLGAHSVPMEPHADLSPPACGKLIADALDALGLTDVTLVGCDSGGAYSQIAAALRAERIGRLVLNGCETPFDSFPPPAFAGLKRAAEQENTLKAALEPLRSPAFRADPRAYGKLAKHGIEAGVSDTYVLPVLDDPAIRRDACKVMRSASESYVQEAGAQLIARFAGKVLLAWPVEDVFFSIENARRYAAMLRDARVEEIHDAYSFSAEDQPARVAALIGGFAARTG